MSNTNLLQKQRQPVTSNTNLVKTNGKQVGTTNANGRKSSDDHKMLEELSFQVRESTTYTFQLTTLSIANFRVSMSLLSSKSPFLFLSCKHWTFNEYYYLFLICSFLCCYVVHINWEMGSKAIGIRMPMKWMTLSCFLINPVGKRMCTKTSNKGLGLSYFGTFLWRRVPPKLKPTS